MEGPGREASSSAAGDGSYPSSEALYYGYLSLPPECAASAPGTFPASALVLVRRPSSPSN